MILKYISGCICGSIKVDGVEEIDIPFGSKIRRVALFKIGQYVSKLTLDDAGLKELRNKVCGYLDLDKDEIKDKSAFELGEIIKDQPARSLNYILQFIIPLYGQLTYVSDDECEDCGDHIYEYTLSL